MIHRVSLSDADLDLLVSALRARRAMLKARSTREHLDYLIARFLDCTRGNPHVIRGGRCVHGLPQAARCDRCVERIQLLAGLANQQERPTSPSDRPAVGAEPLAERVLVTEIA